MVTRLLRGYDVMVACQLPKLNARVRFPLPAPVSAGPEPDFGNASVDMEARALGRNSRPAEPRLRVVVSVADG